MCNRWPYLAVVFCLFLASGCKKPPVQQPVVVHLFRDLYSPYAHDLDHRILDFQSSNPRLPSGAPIVVKTFNDIEYKTALKGNFARDVKVEVVVLNTPADAAESPVVAAQMAHAVDICASVKACPADVPAFVLSSATGDQAAAGQVFVNFLAQRK
jgi:hypothetical protein